MSALVSSSLNSVDLGGKSHAIQDFVVTSLPRGNDVFISKNLYLTMKMIIDYAWAHDDIGTQLQLFCSQPLLCVLLGRVFCIWYVVTFTTALSALCTGQDLCYLSAAWCGD